MFDLPGWVIFWIAWVVGYSCAAIITHRKDNSPINSRQVLLLGGIYLVVSLLFVKY